MSAKDMTEELMKAQVLVEALPYTVSYTHLTLPTNSLV